MKECSENVPLLQTQRASMAIHKTMIDVREDGTAAAAGTGKHTVLQTNSAKAVC